MNMFSMRPMACYIDDMASQFVSSLLTLVRQPSVSADRVALQKCASLLKEIMTRAGISTKIISIKDGAPIVYGEVESKASDKTLLVYDHYDVQSPGLLDQWVVDPFAADIVNGRIVARGASDSKGNLMAFVNAVAAYLQKDQEVPVNVKFLFEGEEEIGSPHLPRFIAENKTLLKGDAAVCFDGASHSSGRPLIELGLKGMLYVEFICETAMMDLHSMWAPIIESAAWRLMQALETLREPNGRIAIQGWYDAVNPPTSYELELLRDIPLNEDQLLREFRTTAFIQGVSGVEVLKQLLYEPTCNISGIGSGDIGSGLSTILPSRATAKVDFRLVTAQNPRFLFEKLKQHLISHCFHDVNIKLHVLLEPSRTPPLAPIVHAVTQAAKEVYRVTPVVYPCSAGSGPDYLFTKVLGLDSLWTGCSPAFSNPHSPNEFTTVDAFLKGIKFAVGIMHQFG